ncbi:hypothetical protein FB382_000482 [Nocardioides ginsengisegetis]|uniref:Uncharacterized protein n=1 Tax=Nocardioides ginsengisegetis TaxID=661491 RepID=A0A7W3IX01_9ACTN|nr:hypothetical protein [Nocardioides ginsengisegetis]MBA8802191.1 hypothetical protein [Nocardioides ginsengisegetis]
MNRYSLAAESRTWWCPSAAAGSLGATAVALVALSTPVAVAMPVETTRSEAPASLVPFSSAATTGVERPCFILQPHWNTGLDGPQPTCLTQVSDPVAERVATGSLSGGYRDEPDHVIRLNLDYLP